MGGIIRGALAGSLFTLTLTYFTSQRFNSVEAKLHDSLITSKAIIDNRNTPIEPQSNIKSYTIRDWKEGAKDIWNEEVIRAVNWIYGLDISGASVGVIESTITAINNQLQK